MKYHKQLTNSRWIVILAFLVFTTFTLWAYFSEISVIARAQGIVIASTRTQVIQSANDGVIEEILVREGDRVKKGEILARLDKSQAAAAVRESLAKVAALKAALVRLEAEIYGRALVFPPELNSYDAFISNQTDLFHRRQKAIKSEVGALESGLRLLKEELDLSMPLLASGDIGKIEIIRLQRQIAELNGQISNRRNKYFQDAQVEMTKVEEDLSTQQEILTERLVVNERMEIRASSDGIVKNIQISTLGSKVRPGEVVMELMPTGTDLLVEAKLKPSDIAYVSEGLPAAVKLDAFDYSIYGTLQGKVVYVSPDVLFEKTASGEQPYYRIQVHINNDALERYNINNPSKLVDVQPGMTGMVDVQTGMQKILAYLTKPIVKTLSSSMGER